MRPEVLKQRLLERAATGKFGHFYLLSGAPADQQRQIEWTEDFIRSYWSSVEGRQAMASDLRSDADLLWLTPPRGDDEEVLDYKVEGIEAQLAGFLPYRGLKSRRRFVIIEESHRLTPVIANKLLKTLEEPEGELTFLWLNPQGKKFLPTIESRALGLKLSWPVIQQQVGATLTELRARFSEGNFPLAEFLEAGKKGEFDPYQLLDELLTLERLESGPAAYQQELLTVVKEWDEAERFNSPIAPRLQALHYLLSLRFRSGR